MTVRRYQAPTLAAALRAVERDQGRDALIVETRDTPQGFVVFACPPDDPAALQPQPRNAAAPQHDVLTPARRRAPHRQNVRLPAGLPASGESLPDRVPHTRWRGDWSPGFGPFAERAARFGLSPTILRAVEKALAGTAVRLDREGDPALPNLAARVLAGLIPTTDLDGADPEVVALVGPTGVGKTTTLAKLAAGWIADGRSVAVLTIDTYRIAAVEQLRAYADLLGVRCEVAFTPADLARHVADLAGIDRILIDTSGRSPLDGRAIEAMRAALSRAKPRTLLCLPAAARRADAADWLDGFAALRPHAAVLTKWDETRAPGEALSLAIERNLPLSHVTVGQEVPDDIVHADPRSLATFALGMHPDQALETVR